MSEQGVLDIPDIRTFEYSTAEKEVQDFAAAWGTPPKTVALPVLLPYGVPFENELTPAAGVRYGGGTSDMYLGGIAHEFAKLGLNIILTVNPSMAFAKSPALHIMDISGDGSAQACLGKTATRRLLKSFVSNALRKVREACESVTPSGGSAPTVEGVALDIENLWPMGATNERVELTCFCEECRQQLASLSRIGKKLVSGFERFPNPWNLLLQDSGTGVRPISDVEWEATPKAIADISHLKGFDKVLIEAGIDVQKEAELLLEYMHTRHKQTLQAIEDFFSEIAPHDGQGNIRRILIVEENAYDWTEGLFFKKLDNKKVCDELWFDPSELALSTSRIPHRVYMHRRCRYFVNAFFEHLSRCQDENMRTTTGLAHLSDERLKSSLELRRRQAMSNRLASRLDLFCLHPVSGDPQSGRTGFVGNNLSDDLSAALVKNAKLVPASPDQIEEKERASIDMLKALLGGRLTEE